MFDNDISKNLDITKPLTIDGKNNKLTGTLTLSGANVTVKNVEVNNKVVVKGENAVLDTITIKEAHSTQQDGTSQPHNHMVDVTGKNITIKNSTFSGSSDTSTYGVFRDAIFIEDAATGDVTITGNTFTDLKNVYNGIDFGNSFKVNNLVFKDNKFDPEILHNALSMYDFEEGANITIENCELPSMRISNFNNATATINFNSGRAVFTEAELSQPSEWGFLLFQQVRKEESFKTITVNINGFKNPKGNKYTAEGTEAEKFCSYYNSTDPENHKVAPENEAKINYVS